MDDDLPPPPHPANCTISPHTLITHSHYWGGNDPSTQQVYFNNYPGAEAQSDCVPLTFTSCPS
jgi:hypothetical protein